MVLLTYCGSPHLKALATSCDFTLRRVGLFLYPKSKNIVLKRDTGVCKGMWYIDLCTTKAKFAIIEILCKNVESYAKKYIEKAKFYCTLKGTWFEKCS